MSSPLDTDDTIAAISSAPGPGARGLVRITGADAFRIAGSFFQPELDAPADRPPRASLRRGWLALEGLRPRLAAALALWPAPRTYTGQDVAEVHLVGSPPLLDLVLSQCLARGARPAQAGEFTLRAFLNGRLDLTRAEAVLGVIDAQNPAQLEAALEQLAGGISAPIAALRDRLLDLTALIEANLDFVDEHDVDPVADARLAGELDAASADLAGLAARLSGRDRPSHLPRVVLLGPPNAGKSRLFNAMAGEDHAIVSPVAGTTRDYLVARCDCDGVAFELVDTAGEEAPGEPIQAQAQDHRGEQARRADLLLLCEPAPDEGSSPGETCADAPFLRVRTKCDLVTSDEPPARDDPIRTSAATGDGLAALRSAIAEHLRARPGDGDQPAGTAARCRDSLARAGDSLASAAEALRSALGQELVAFELRSAIDELGKVVGATFTDDILDRIFSRFCIGK
ncbi:tRNA modification GTPase MnmE [Aquisphaera giovannonii]|uniref:tRNA modification GTPase MnmE n=1 Tax=Aquisphaera giovannonii TaxID=406548 RepID=A0A5B9W1U2_9BACT|nr:tRNA modification GTPase [Aquisphaera giovannonii]QEH34161.1 tRNA modification GTPase MnmE [Aquisphaera giovannonii]